MYSLSIILPFIDEINSLKKTIDIINKQNKENKEFLIIISSKKTPTEMVKKLNKHIKSSVKRFLKDVLHVILLQKIKWAHLWEIFLIKRREQ